MSSRTPDCVASRLRECPVCRVFHSQVEECECSPTGSCAKHTAEAGRPFALTKWRDLRPGDIIIWDRAVSHAPKDQEAEDNMQVGDWMTYDSKTLMRVTAYEPRLFEFVELRVTGDEVVLYVKDDVPTYGGLDHVVRRAL